MKTMVVGFSASPQKEATNIQLLKLMSMVYLSEECLKSLVDISA